MRKEIYAVISFLCTFVAYAMNPLLPLDWFYKLIAGGFTFLWLFVYLSSRGWWSITFFILFCLSLNNLLDELFFDPTKYDWNEYISLIIIVLISIKGRKKWMR